MNYSITFIFSCSVTTDPTLQNGDDGRHREEDDEEGKILSLLDNAPKYLVDDEQEGNKSRVK